MGHEPQKFVPHVLPHEKGILSSVLAVYFRYIFSNDCSHISQSFTVERERS